MSIDSRAVELFATISQRRAFLGCVLERDGPTHKQTLLEELDLTRPTVERVIRDLCDVGLFEKRPDDVTPTLLAALACDEYHAFVQQIAAIGKRHGDPDALWPTEAERQEVTRLVASRLGILENIWTTPHDKRDLVDSVDASRSTVDRAIRELEVVELVAWSTEGYTTTLAGRQAAAQYRATVETIGDLLAAQDVLTALPRECSIESALLADAAVECSADAAPYHLPDGIRDRITAADRARVCLPTLATPLLLDCCHRGVVQEDISLEVLISSALFETLTADFPGPLADMAVGGSYTAFVAETASDGLLPFGLVLAETETTTTVSVVVYGAQGTIQGAIHNETDAAVQWAEEQYERLRSKASDVTGEMCTLASATGPTEGNVLSDGERIALEAEGFVHLTPTYFAQRAPAPPTTGWRTGFELVDVHAGYAIDREVEDDGSRYNLTEDIIERLSKGTNLAVLGSPGSGKSTVCKTVACRWYEQGMGPVFYRASGRGTTFTSPAVLEGHLREIDRHALVVVEDAMRAEATAVFRLMKAFRGTTEVTFLLDAREREWANPESFPIDARLEAYRNEAIETVIVPALDDREADRFVKQFERTIDEDLDSSVTRRLRESETAEEQPTSRAISTDTPCELLLFLHRLALYADPLVVYDAHLPTTFIEDVQRSYEDLRQTSDLALDVGILVNLLNAAGIGVTPTLVYALADSDDAGADADITVENEHTIDEIHEVLSAIEGRAIFEREGSGSDVGPYRTIHESWSAQFLDHLLETETERAASRRFGRCVTALLSLADDTDRRDQITSGVVGETPSIDRIADAPGEWADETVKQVFGLGKKHRALTALFGTTDDSCIDLPDACSRSVAVNCTIWRAKMAEEAGDLDRAEHEFEAVKDLAREVEETDPEWAVTLRGRRLQGLAIVAKARGEFDTAEEYYTRALEPYREAGDTRYLSQTRANLGVVEYARGNLEPAEAQYQQSIETARENGYTQLEATTLFNLALVVGMNDEMEAAIEYFEQALDLHREGGNRQGESRTLIMLGEAVAHRGALDTAEEYCKQALETVRELGIRSREAHCLAALGTISQRRGDLDTAEAYYQQSLHIRREIGHTTVQAWTLTDLGEIAAERGDFDTAEEHCEKSREISQDVGDQNGKANSLALLGDIARKQGDLVTAEEHTTASLTIHDETGNDSDGAKSRRLLGRVACAQERFSTAEDHLTRALSSFRDLGYRYEEAKTLAALGSLAQAQTDKETAREWFEEAIALYRDIGAIRDTIETTAQLVAVCEEMNDLTAALAHCETARTLAQETEFADVPTSLDERRTQLAEYLINGE